MGQAWSRLKKAEARTWGEWMIIGDGLMAGRTWAMQVAGVNKPEGRGYVTAYAQWLRRYRVDDMDKSDRAKLLRIVEERAAVEEWRATLSDHERRNLNNPVVVWRKWTAATRVRKPKPPRLTGPSDIADQLQARVSELEEELRTSSPRAPDLNLRQTVERLRALAAGPESWPQPDDVSTVRARKRLLDALKIVASLFPDDEAPAQLVWEDGDPLPDLSGRNGAYHRSRAPAAHGVYSVSPSWDAFGGAFAGYGVSHLPNGKVGKKHGERVIANGIKDAGKAKATAQADHDAELDR
jgi:hypothetical protein